MVRAETLLALGESAAAVSVDAFVDFLGDPQTTVRVAALQGFSKRDDDSFLTVLSGLDPDPHWSVRAALATVLGTKDPSRALPRLMPMLSDTDARVIPSVLTALTKLKAPDIGNILVAAARQRRRRCSDVGGDQYRRGQARRGGGGADRRLQARRGRSGFRHADCGDGGALEVRSRRPHCPRSARLSADKDWAVRVKAAELLKGLDPTVETAQAMRPAPSARAGNYEDSALVNPTVSPHVYIETEKGTIEVELDVLDAPQTSDNFIALARKGYFDGLTFHRVVPNFVIQGGDPRGDGDGGPGYSIRDELNQEPYLRGAVGMALAWRDTGGSQFFITHSPQPHLDARYTVFGRVVAGMEVVDRITQWDVMKHVRVWDGGGEKQEGKREVESYSVFTFYLSLLRH